MPSNQGLKKFLEDLIARAKAASLPPSRIKEMEGAIATLEKRQTTPKGTPRKARSASLKKPVIPIKGAGAGAVTGAIGKPGFLAKAGAAIKAHPVKAGVGGLLGLMLASGIKGQVKSRMKRSKQAKAIRGLPPATIDAVLQARRQQQMLATKRAMLMRNDPEAFQLLMMGLSGEQPQALARGEVLLGRQPQIAPQAAQNVESLLAAMG